MGFFRVRGRSITLLHGVRDNDMGVRHLRLRTFSGPDELQSYLAPDAWTRLQAEIGQDHPELRLDWKALREQALALCSVESRPLDLGERVRTTRKAVRALGKSLDGLPPEKELFLKAVGPDLVQAVRVILTRYAELGTMDDDLLELLLRRMLPDLELAERLVDEGREAFRRGASAVAAKKFRAARFADPSDPDILNSEAVGWLGKGDLAKAEELLVEARELALLQLPNPRKAYSWSQHEVRPYLRTTLNLSLVRQRQQRWQEALELCQECLERCPNDGIGARFQLGPLLQSAGRLQEAAEEHRRACSGNLVNIPDPFFDLCNVELQLGHYARAVETFCEGVRVNRHVPKHLLKPPRRPKLPDYAASGSLQEALCYVSDRASSWPAQSLECLRLIWKDRQLMAAIKEIEEVEAEMDVEPAGEDRGRLFQQLCSLQDRLLGPASAEALYHRTLGARH